MKTKNMGFDSKLIHSGDIHERFGSAVTPIYQTSTFSFRNAQHGADLFSGKEKGYIYTRMGNPTINALENKLADLENGYRGIALASGMAAVTTVYMTLLGQGDHMLVFNRYRLKKNYLPDKPVEDIFIQRDVI